MALEYTESGTSTNSNAGAANNIANGSNDETNSLFKAGSLYKGVITSCIHADGLYNVSTEGYGGPIQQCELGIGICNALLGFKTTIRPTVGSHVIVLGGRPPVIVGMLPTDLRDDLCGKNRTMTGTSEDISAMLEGATGTGVHHTAPADLLEGEFAIENTLGVALQFLTNLISLKGSERAKVEACLLNDMVRVVSETYKHMSAFGDFEIYNDGGGLNVKFEGTSRQHEALGLMDEDEQKAQTTSNEVEMDADLAANARMRFSQYVGFLGDFIHMFVTDPSTLASNIGESLRAGKSRIWCGMDGTLLMQSVTEIAIERVVRIPVPQEKKRWDDPTGVVKQAWKGMLDSQKEFMKVWNYGEGLRDIHHAAYQLREYARWMNCYHSYARFHQYDNQAGEWHVPREDEIAHSWNNKEADVEAANTQLRPDYFDTYACIRIMRDGAVVVWDGYGSSLSMSRGCISLSAMRHLDLEAAGDVRIVAGNDIVLRARRHVEITATVGSIVTKARTAWKALCEWGSIWLKSDAQDPAAPGFMAPTPEDATEDPAPEIHDAAIILDTSKGRMTLNSARTLTLQTDGQTQPDAAADAADRSKSIVLQSQTQDVVVVGRRSIRMSAEGSNSGNLSIDSSSEVLVSTNKFLTNCYTFDIGGKFTISNKGAIVNATSLRSENIYAQKPIYGGLASPEIDLDTECCYVQHENHVLLSTAQQAPEFATPTELDDYVSGVRPVMRFASAFDSVDPANGPSWRFYLPGTHAYDWKYMDPADKGREERYVQLAQQRTSFDTDLQVLYKDWELTNNTLKEAPRTISSEVPYPGKGSRELFHDSAMEGLGKVFTGEYSAQDPSIRTRLTNRPFARRFLKPSTNKQ